MKKIIPMLTALVAIGACQGCKTSVPQTEITLPTKLGLFKIVSPKETEWSAVTVEMSPDGTTKASIGKVATHNSADVIATVGNANAQMADRFNSLADKLIQAGKEGGTRAATGGLVP